MNINDNEKVAYLVKQLYDYWRKNKEETLTIERSELWPKLSDSEAAMILSELASKTFSISYHTVDAFGAYDRYGNEEEAEVIPGRFHITLTDDFEEYALKLIKTYKVNNGAIQFNKLSSDLIIGNKKVHFTKGTRRSFFIETILDRKYRKKVLTADDDIPTILGDKMVGIPTEETKTKYYVFFDEINKRIHKDTSISDFLIFTKNDCQINPKYLANII